MQQGRGCLEMAATGLLLAPDLSITVFNLFNIAATQIWDRGTADKSSTRGHTPLNHHVSTHPVAFQCIDGGVAYGPVSASEPCPQAPMLPNTNIEVAQAWNAWYFFSHEKHQR